MQNETKIPNGYECPITGELMVDPVVAADGHTYERAAIEEWFRAHATSPLTRATLSCRTLLPNFALKKAISEFRGGDVIPSLTQQGFFAQANPPSTSEEINDEGNSWKPEGMSCAIL